MKLSDSTDPVQYGAVSYYNHRYYLISFNFHIFLSALKVYTGQLGFMKVLNFKMRRTGRSTKTGFHWAEKASKQNFYFLAWQIGETVYDSFIQKFFSSLNSRKTAHVESSHVGGSAGSFHFTKLKSQEMIIYIVWYYKHYFQFQVM